MNLNFTNVDVVCRNARREDDGSFVVDLSAVTFVVPFGLVYLGMYLRWMNAQGFTVNVIPPASREVRGYFARQRFWERFNFTQEVVARERLLRLTRTTSLNDIVDIPREEWVAEDVAQAVFDLLRRNGVRVPIAQVAEMIGEVVDNFAQHSDQPLAACTMQYYPNSGRFAFAIGDCGIGIRSSLASNPAYAALAEQPHYEAARAAFEPMVSRKPEGGMGLTDIRDTAVALGGRVILTTGDGFVVVTDDNVRIGNMAFDLPGVQIEVSIPEGL